MIDQFNVSLQNRSNFFQKKFLLLSPNFDTFLFFINHIRNYWSELVTQEYPLCISGEFNVVLFI